MLSEQECKDLRDELKQLRDVMNEMSKRSQEISKILETSFVESLRFFIKEIDWRFSLDNQYAHDVCLRSTSPKITEFLNHFDKNRYHNQNYQLDDGIWIHIYTDHKNKNIIKINGKVKDLSGWVKKSGLKVKSCSVSFNGQIKSLNQIIENTTKEIEELRELAAQFIGDKDET